MEMIMSTITNATLQRDFFLANFSTKVAGILRRWWIAYMKWRLDALAISQLQSMGDRELRDMGVSRAQIELAVRGDGSDPRFTRYY
jgi:uncharacterized protein YjiS (DUF1127 family)